jgi:hypothetical protein
MSRAARWCLVAAQAAWLAVGARPVPLEAQVLEGTIGAYAVQHRVLYHGTVYDQAGTGFEARGSLGLGPVVLGLAGWRAGLTADGGLPNGDVTVRTTALWLDAAILPVLALGGQIETRRFTSDAGITVWQLRGWEARFHPELGFPGLRGVAEVALLSSGQVRGGSRMDVALQTTMGISYTLRGSPLRLRLAYRFERYDLRSPAGEAARLEQFRGLLMEASVVASPSGHGRARR